MLDTIIRDIRLLGADGIQAAELGIDGGVIVDRGAEVAGACRQEIAGGGAYCLPGAVDLHVHFNEPGRMQWEGFATGSAAAAAGGVTYLAEMPLNSIPSTVSVAALETKLAAIAGKSYVDFGLWGGVVPGNAEDLAPLAAAGVMGFKAFMSPSGTDDFLNADTATLRMAMQRIAPTGLRLALHAEDPAVLARAAASRSTQLSAFDWEAARPVEAELSAVKIAIDLSAETACPISIVHVSSAEVLAVIDAAKAGGVDILCETCPHYLLLSTQDADAIGANAKCAPPLRAAASVTALREALLAGRIDTLGSDHSPSSPELKADLSFYDAWGGIAGLQHGWPLVLDHFGLEDAATLERLQKVSAENPATHIHLPRKGRLQVGMDADFCLMQKLPQPAKIRADALLTRHPLSAYTGRSLGLEVLSTWLRGQCVLANGRLPGPPRGRFIAAQNK
ncbi:MAG: allantoinase AllB [Puniceicoccaceae bacterium]|nr:MAG: allantoinase AllB [Puniceicoccaceae bacterium]